MSHCIIIGYTYIHLYRVTLMLTLKAFLNVTVESEYSAFNKPPHTVIEHMFYCHSLTMADRPHDRPHDCII